MIKKRLCVIIFLLLTVFMLSACGTEVAEPEPTKTQESVISDLVSVENDSDIQEDVTTESSDDNDIETDTTVEEEVQPSEEVEASETQEEQIKEEQESEEPQETTHSYIANKNSKKLHYTYCESVDKMKESNKVYLDCTRSEALERGYTPCKNCNP